jgi:hypothetical protein
MKYFISLKGFTASIVGTSLLLIALAGARIVLSQDQTSSALNRQILRDKVKADKKLMVANYMELTDAEAKVFWPIYDSYQADLMALNERLDKNLQCHADAYNDGKLTDQIAKKIIDEDLAIVEAEINMRKAYWLKLNVVLPGTKAARFLQIEDKIRAQLRYELATEVPLI